MAFGAMVTDFAQAAVGSAGYTIKVSLINDLLVSVDAVQAQASASSTPAPVTDETIITTLLGYLNSDDAPDLAYYFSEGEITIFFNSTTFDYVDDTRFAIWGYRKGHTGSSFLAGV